MFGTGILKVLFLCGAVAIMCCATVASRQKPSEPSALHAAALAGDPEGLAATLGGHIDVNARDTTGATALHLAVINGNPTVVELLLRGGADVNAPDGAGQTPLMYAAEYGRDEALNALLKAGARVTARDAGGRTSLHWAAQCRNAYAARRLLAAGADRTARDGDGRTPIDTAEFFDSEAVAQILRHSSTRSSARGAWHGERVGSTAAGRALLVFVR